MGHKFYAVKVRARAEEMLRFGTVASYESGKFLTVHTAMRNRVCGYCHRSILRGSPYVRLHTPRDPENGDRSWHEARCFNCIEKGILPSKEVQYIKVVAT